MAEKTPNWLRGCGIGCGAIILLFVVLAAAGAMFVRGIVSEFDTAIETRKTLEEEFGAVADYTPAANGAVAPERMEVFLAIRGKTEPAQKLIADFFESLPMSEEEAEEIESQSFFEKVGTVLNISKSAMGLGEQIGHFFQVRNQAMLDGGMGMGEYTYIYVLAYYTWLGNSPSDGADDARSADRRRDRDERDVVRRGRLKRRLRENFLTIMLNQQAALLEQPDSEALQEWRRRIAAEIAAMEDDRQRLPWEEGLPEQIAASFEPFGDRLRATYSPITNEFELQQNRRGSSWSIHSD